MGDEATQTIEHDISRLISEQIATSLQPIFTTLTEFRGRLDSVEDEQKAKVDSVDERIERVLRMVEANSIYLENNAKTAERAEARIQSNERVIDRLDGRMSVIEEKQKTQSARMDQINREGDQTRAIADENSRELRFQRTELTDFQVRANQMSDTLNSTRSDLTETKQDVRTIKTDLQQLKETNAEAAAIIKAQAERREKMIQFAQSRPGAVVFGGGGVLVAQWFGLVDWADVGQLFGFVLGGG